ncbi:unnamed protein product, partial [Amoebophrya sp. A25]
VDAHDEVLDAEHDEALEVSEDEQHSDIQGVFGGGEEVSDHDEHELQHSEDEYQPSSEDDDDQIEVGNVLQGAADSEEHDNSSAGESQTAQQDEEQLRDFSADDHEEQESISSPASAGGGGVQEAEVDLQHSSADEQESQPLYDEIQHSSDEEDVSNQKDDVSEDSFVEEEVVLGSQDEGGVSSEGEDDDGLQQGITPPAASPGANEMARNTRDKHNMLYYGEQGHGSAPGMRAVTSTSGTSSTFYSYQVASGHTKSSGSSRSPVGALILEDRHKEHENKHPHRLARLFGGHLLPRPPLTTTH